MNINYIIDSIISRVLTFFKKHIDFDEGQHDVLSYAIRLVINTIIAYTLTFIPAILLNTFKYVLIITLSFAALRIFSGGAHNSNIFNCSTNGAIISNILGIIIKYIDLNKGAMFTLFIATFLFSLWAVGKYAPADTPSKPITTNAKKSILRRNSFIVLSFWGFTGILWFKGDLQSDIYIYASTIGILWQSFALTKTGYKLYHLLDGFLNFFQRKEGLHD